MTKKITLLFLALFFVFGMAQPSLAATAKPSYFLIEGNLLVQSIKDINKLLNPLKFKRNTALEKKLGDQYVHYLIANTTGLNQYIRPLVFFVTYGTPSTRQLTPAERSGLLNAYKLAFSKLPMLQTDWADVIRISKNTKPVAISLTAELKARTEFRKAYGREAVIQGDRAALNIIAYGLFPLKRNFSLERSAIGRFKSVYGFLPIYGQHWNVVRAYAYSGVK